MQLTRQGEYAIRAVLELARLPYGEVVSTKEVADRQGVPEAFLAKIMQILSRSDIVFTVRGPQGGVRLARSADEISLRQVVEAVEGPIYLNSCLANGAPCHQSPQCRVHQVWMRAQKAMLNELEGVSLAQLIEPEKPKEEVEKSVQTREKS